MNGDYESDYAYSDNYEQDYGAESLYGGGNDGEKYHSTEECTEKYANDDFSCVPKFQLSGILLNRSLLSKQLYKTT